MFPLLRFSVYLRPISLLNSRPRIPYDHHMYNCVLFLCILPLISGLMFCECLVRTAFPGVIFLLFCFEVPVCISIYSRELLVFIRQRGNSTTLYHISLLPHPVYDAFTLTSNTLTR